MTTTSILASALAFARRGYAVFPVTWPIELRGRLACSCGSDLRGRPCTAPAKHPYVRLAPNGVHSSTTAEDEIRRWFSGAPQANLGVHLADAIELNGVLRYADSRSKAFPDECAVSPDCTPTKAGLSAPNR